MTGLRLFILLCLRDSNFAALTGHLSELCCQSSYNQIPTTFLPFHVTILTKMAPHNYVLSAEAHVPWSHVFAISVEHATTSCSSRRSSGGDVLPISVRKACRQCRAHTVLSCSSHSSATPSETPIS